MSKTPLLHRIRCEFVEAPGLRLTVAEAVRLFALDPRTACELLETLTAAGFLFRKKDGVYSRASRV